MNRSVRVKLFGGPFDGYLMSVQTVNGKPPSSIDMRVPSPVPDFIPEDGPYPIQSSENDIVTYERTRTHPSQGLLPVYQLRRFND